MSSKPKIGVEPKPKAVRAKQSIIVVKGGDITITSDRHTIAVLANDPSVRVFRGREVQIERTVKLSPIKGMSTPVQSVT